MAACPTPQKVAHADRGAAEVQRRELVAKGKDGGRYLVVYRCLCDRWHVGHDGRLWSTAIRNAVRAGNTAGRMQRRRRRR